MARPYAEVIGDPIAHSRSPLIHRFWLAKLGLDGDYLARRVTEEELPDYLSSSADDPDWRGCNVTAPLKVSALPFMGSLTGLAEKCGAVNTITPDRTATRQGHNTDALAVARLLRGFGQMSYPGRVATYVQIIGAGGAARAAVIGATEAGHYDFDFFNRTLAGAQMLAIWLGLNPEVYAATLDRFGPIRNPEDGPGDQRYSHVVINATGMGTNGRPAVPIDLSSYYPDTIVLDFAYGQEETKLVREARRLRLRVADGLEILVEQASAAFELFFGARAPREHDRELRELLTS